MERQSREGKNRKIFPENRLAETNQYHQMCNLLTIARARCEMFLMNSKRGLYEGKSQQEILKLAGEIMGDVIERTDRAIEAAKKDP